MTNPLSYPRRKWRSYKHALRLALRLQDQDALSSMRAAKLACEHHNAIVAKGPRAQFESLGCTCQWLTRDGVDGIIRFDHTCPVLDEHHFDPDRTIHWTDGTVSTPLRSK